MFCQITDYLKTILLKIKGLLKNSMINTPLQCVCNILFS